MTPDRNVDVYASRQHGVLSLDQARRAGFTDNMVHGRLEAGAWVRLASGVYAVASAPPKWERQVAAAILSRPRAIVSGASAAYLHGFEGYRRGRPEITVPMRTSVRSPLARVARSIWFDELGTTKVSGFKVANVAETLLVLAGRIPAARLERLTDDQLAAGVVAVEDFEPIRRRVSNGRVRGSGVLFPLLDERAADAWEPPANQLEGYLNRLVDDPAVPPASRQHPFRFDRLPMIVDIYIAAWRLILEADGRRWHSRRADFERDRARDNSAAAAGIAVLRFTWRMLTEDLAGCRRILLQTGATR
ncbi:MAG TPA: type IV toxin-antitoxin system AbiEi family antitoxin domain-containing protein [Acidimicrobiia bacterium]|nr:type IV toxin-antitoxin system AbiEi family antitoxin domain-containing protein [Acidimicrobiia bacterium]